jgi:hypothetical protein
MDYALIFPSICIGISAILLYVAVSKMTAVQGSANTTIDYREPYGALIEKIMWGVTIGLGAILLFMFLRFPDYFHYSFYLIPSILAFSLSFAALAMSFITKAA